MNNANQLGQPIGDSFGPQPLPAQEPVVPAGIPPIEPARVTAQIVEFIRHHLDLFQRDGVILGLSGGIDSACVAHLAVRALRPDQVKVLLLPERDSSPESRTDALREIERLGIPYQEVSLTPLLTALGAYRLTPLQFLGPRAIKAAVVQQQHRAQAKALGEMPFRAGLLGTRNLGEKKHLIDVGNAYARVKHRLRLTVLYYYADLENRLVLGTTNRSEASTGFVVKWGDNVADIEPLLPLYKTHVYQLATYLGVCEPIVAKAPTPDLIPGIVDTLALGVDYGTLDKILWGIHHDWPEQQIVDTFAVTTAQVSHVQEMWRRSDHLRKMPPAPDLGLD
ncbi:MAG: NAD(+) synthase [Chloroflexi bacterium]|nr:NAD(+) synthase [Chloroflexota bacterium]